MVTSPGTSNVEGNDDISMNIPKFHKIPTPPQILPTDTRSRKNYKSLVPPKLNLETPTSRLQKIARRLFREVRLQFSSWIKMEIGPFRLAKRKKSEFIPRANGGHHLHPVTQAFHDLATRKVDTFLNLFNHPK